MDHVAPELFHLHRVGWQFFGTLTFTSEREIPVPDVRVKMFFSLVRDICRATKTHFHSCLWVLRQEAGEALGREHLHYLMGGLPEPFVTKGLCFCAMGAWEAHGGGFARVRIYDGGSNALSYALKCLGVAGADRYEFEKFGTASQLIVAHSVQRLLVGHLGRIERATNRALADAHAPNAVSQCMGATEYVAPCGRRKG